MQGKKFQKKIEDFKCSQCGNYVSGTGYTNHCPRCLWSKHVDNNPGDRKNDCLGAMEPVNAFFKKGRWYLIQKCTKCAHEAKITLSEQDNIKIIEGLIDKSTKI